MKTLSGHSITRYEGEELATLRKEFQGIDTESNPNGWVRVNPGNWVLPSNFDQVADQIYQFRFRKGDIIVNTCSNAGVTWMQEIIWTMKNNPNLDNPDAKLSMDHRSLNLDIDAYIGTKGPLFEKVLNDKKARVEEIKEGEGTFLNMLNTLPGPRVIKTHLPLSLLPPDTLDIAKVVYVARNPYDVCVSNFHQCRLMNWFKYTGTFENFAQRFMDGNIPILPFWEHVYEGWNKRNCQNVNFIFYEDLKRDPLKEILKLNTFLETNLTEKQLENIVHYTSFSEMKKRGVLPTEVDETPEQINMELKKKEGGFLSKEIVGCWKNDINQETLTKMKLWVESSMKDMEIPFIYEID